MIPFDFEYVKPKTIEEAVNQYKKISSNGRKVCFYSGGTEFISRARKNEFIVDAIIDLKGISECNTIKMSGDKIIIGSAVTLSSLVDHNYFPLLNHICRSIGTKTARNKITIGGNLTSNLIYREAILAFLLSESELIIAGPNGERRAGINEIVETKRKLLKEEFIVQIITKKRFINYPHMNLKRTQHSNVNYPIISIAAMKVEKQIRFAFSGLCAQPFRIKEIDAVLNDNSISHKNRIKRIYTMLPMKVIDDMHATSQYRKFVLENLLLKMLSKMEDVS